MPEADRAEALARMLGAHALPLFLALLLLVLAAAGAAWWALRRYGLPRENGRLPPVAFLLLHMALGFALIVGAAAAFAEIAEELGDGERLGHLDQVFSDAVRAGITPAAERAFALVTRLGDTATLTGLGVAVAVLLALRRRSWLAVGWSSALIGNALLNTSLKHVFERTRPVHDSSIEQAIGYSFPSGHTSGSVVAYGMLAYLCVRLLPPAWRLPAVLAATAAAWSIGWSRVFLQVHFASDVVAGFASGTAWLGVCILGIEGLRRYRSATGRKP